METKLKKWRHYAAVKKLNFGCPLPKLQIAFGDLNSLSNFSLKVKFEILIWFAQRDWKCEESSYFNVAAMIVKSCIMFPTI